MRLTIGLLGAVLCSGCARGTLPPVGDLESWRVVDGPVSLYLARSSGGTLVAVDCGLDETGAATKAELATRRVRPEDVRAVFITHRHADHVGGCDVFTAAKRYALPGSDEVPAEALRDGQAVTVGDLEVRVFAVPGHTPDSAAYLIGNTLYLGDAATAAADGQLAASRFRFHDAERAEDVDHQNVAPLRALAQRVRDLPVRQLAFGHSAPSSHVEGLANPR